MFVSKMNDSSCQQNYSLLDERPNNTILTIFTQPYLSASYVHYKRQNALTDDFVKPNQNLFGKTDKHSACNTIGQNCDNEVIPSDDIPSNRC